MVARTGASCWRAQRLFLVAQWVKNPPAVQQTQVDMGSVHHWVRKIPWRRKWQTTPVFLPGESHGQRSQLGYSPMQKSWTWLSTHKQNSLCNNVQVVDFSPSKSSKEAGLQGELRFDQGSTNIALTLGPSSFSREQMGWAAKKIKASRGPEGRALSALDTSRVVNHFWSFHSLPPLFPSLLLSSPPSFSFQSLCHPFSLSPKTKKKYIMWLKNFWGTLAYFPLGSKYLWNFFFYKGNNPNPAFWRS